MKNILIPTDLTIESLQLLSEAIRSNPGEELKIVLIHGLRASDSIQDLLFFKRDNKSEDLIKRDFKNAYEIIKNRNASSVKSFQIEFYGGFTNSAMRNFIEAHQIDEIYLPRGYKFKQASPRSFDLTSLLKGHPVPTLEVVWASTENHPEKNLPAELLHFGSK